MKEVKILGISGSPRKNGNTHALIKTVFEVLKKDGIKTELMQLGGEKIKGCMACYKCFKNKNNECTIKNDILNECIKKMIKADGIIIGSPTYFSNVTTEVKALIDRAGLVSIANGYPLKRKVGAAVVAVRRGGSTNVFDAINKFYFINQVIVPGSIYWNMGFGSDKGEVKDDAEGMNTMKILAENMGWLLKKIKKKI